MTAKQIVNNLLETELEESKREPSMKVLKDNRVELTDEERREVMKSGAVWHMSSNEGKATPAVWKSCVKGKHWFVCNTHRAYACKSTLKAAIKSYKFIETTA